MKIFVTGGTGFIGSHTVKLLAEKGHELMLLVHSNKQHLYVPALNECVEFVRGDLDNIESWKECLIRFKPEAMIHMAWEGLPDYGIDACRRNLNYGVNVFIIAAEIGCKIIVSLGSCWEYAQQIGGLNEDSKIESTRIFPAVKNSLCFVGQAIAKEYGIKFYWPRLFFVYGPGQRNISLIPLIINSIQIGTTPEIKNPTNKNDFVFIKDVTEAIVKILEEKPNKTIYNIGSGYSTSISEVISLVYKTMGYKLDRPIENERIANYNGDNFWADITAIQSDVGWFPKYNLIEGIKLTIKYYVKGNW